jgi:hypothetical protein
MFEKEIILKEQLAAQCLFQCSPARKLPANGGTLYYCIEEFPRSIHASRLSGTDPAEHETSLPLSLYSAFPLPLDSRLRVSLFLSDPT